MTDITSRFAKQSNAVTVVALRLWLVHFSDILHVIYQSVDTYKGMLLYYGPSGRAVALGKEGQVQDSTQLCMPEIKRMGTLENLESRRGEWGYPEHLLVEAYKIMAKQGLVKITTNKASRQNSNETLVFST